jgi:hypothetical protein
MTLKQRWLPSMTVAGSFMTPQKRTENVWL